MFKFSSRAQPQKELKASLLASPRSNSNSPSHGSYNNINNSSSDRKAIKLSVRSSLANHHSSSSDSSDSEEEVILNRWSNIAAQLQSQTDQSDSQILDNVLNTINNANIQERNMSSNSEGSIVRPNSSSLKGPLSVSLGSSPASEAFIPILEHNDNANEQSHFSNENHSNHSSASNSPTFAPIGSVKNRTDSPLAFLHHRSNSFDFRAYKKSIASGSTSKLLTNSSFDFRNKKSQLTQDEAEEEQEDREASVVGIEQRVNRSDTEFSNNEKAEFPLLYLIKKATLIVTKRIPYYVPILGWLPKYNFRDNILYDFISGITIGVLLIAQGLTYAGLANMPPITGLYTAFFPLIIYFLFGSSRHLQLGPEVTSSILIGKSIINFPAVVSLNPSNPDHVAAYVEAGMALTFAIGIVSLGLGFLRLGFLSSILSRPILAGFVLAVAATLITNQLPVLLGLSCATGCGADQTNLDILRYTFSHLSDIHLETCIISLVSLSILLCCKLAKSRYNKAKWLILFPDVLVVVLLATTMGYLIDFKQYNIAVFGVMKYGFIAPSAPKLNQGSATSLISSALTITLLGFVETQLINKKYASKYGYTVSPNRELVALGFCSMIGSFFGSYSAFGSIPRTKVADTAGQKSNFSNLIAATVVMFAIVLLLPLFQYLPKATTASIIFMVAIGLIDMEEILFTIQVKQWVDLFLCIAMVVVTFFAVTATTNNPTHSSYSFRSSQLIHAILFHVFIFARSRELILGSSLPLVAVYY
jgi:MFS superfamily sulfate permease-like transporter